ncbi:MAG: hypothetical protein J0M07_03830 [Anaerolineae bacterium]|nr:hypothetical protein [Anaerolineae bacterium]
MYEATGTNLEYLKPQIDRIVLQYDANTEDSVLLFRGWRTWGIHLRASDLKSGKQAPIGATVNGRHAIVHWVPETSTNIVVGADTPKKYPLEYWRCERHDLPDGGSRIWIQAVHVPYHRPDYAVEEVTRYEYEQYVKREMERATEGLF